MIVSEGQVLTNLYFIRKGVCEVLADAILDRVTERVKIGKYGPLDYFAQEGALNAGAVSRFTVVAVMEATKEVKTKSQLAECKEKGYVECLQFRYNH